MILKDKGVLVIYTGGTIGSRHKDPLDTESPQVVVSWDELYKATPELQTLTERGMTIAVKSFDEPLDSCNVGQPEWQRMARIIQENYESADGFCILHGTDSMVYTGSALSFMLRNLSKPVILTGAQRSAMVDVRNDASQNFITALLLANPSFSGLPVVPEVCIFFGKRLFRANRTVKNDTAGYDAYVSFNFPPLGEAGDKILIDPELVRSSPESGRRFQVNPRIENNVTTVLIHPGIQDTKIVERQLLGDPSLKGAIVLSYGSGNIPTRPEFLDIFREARQRGIVLVNVSQCRRGGVEMGIYETSALLLEAGFVSGDDITLEAAVCKLRALLGDPDLTQAGVEEYFQQNIAGEQSSSLYVTRYPATTNIIETRTSEAATIRLAAQEIRGSWSANRRLDRALLRLRRATITKTNSVVPGGEQMTGDSSDESYASFRVFLNLQDPSDASPDHPGFCGHFRKYAVQNEGIVIFDVTRAVTALLKPGDRGSFSLFLDTPQVSMTWREAELALIVRESPA